MKRLATWDFALGWPEHKERPFISWLREKCKLRDMGFLWVHNGNVDEIIRELEIGKIRIKFLFDMNATYSVPYDKYAHLCYAVKDTGGEVLNDPDDAKSATDKSVTHYDFLESGISVPFTVVIRKWESESFKLTESERRNLGTPFVIKPASGYGKIGVITDARSVREVAKARNYMNGDNFLLQEKIEPVIFGKKRGWFRVFYVFGEIIPCWWDTSWGASANESRTDEYEQVTLSEMYNFRLLSLIPIVSRIAHITNMKFFTTELAIRKKDSQEIPVAIDYVNDQCDLDIKSQESSAPSDDVVEHIVERIVQCAWYLQHGEQIPEKCSIWVAI